jgi:class 3 adenylate cyclase
MSIRLFFILFFLFCRNGSGESLPFFRVNQNGIERSLLDFTSGNEKNKVDNFTFFHKAGRYGISFEDLYLSEGLSFPGFSHKGLIGLRFTLFIPAELPDSELVFAYSSSLMIQSATVQLLTIGLARDKWVEATVWLPDFQSAEDRDSILFRLNNSFHKFYIKYRENAIYGPNDVNFALLDESRRDLLNTGLNLFARQVLLNSIEVVFPEVLSEAEYFQQVRKLSSWPFEELIINLFFLLLAGVFLLPLFFMRKYLSMKILLLLFLPVSPLLFFLVTRGHEFVRSLEESTMQLVLDDLGLALAEAGLATRKTEQQLEKTVYEAASKLHKSFWANQDEEGNDLFSARHFQWLDEWNETVSNWRKGDKKAYDRLIDLVKDVRERFYPYCRTHSLGRLKLCSLSSSENPEVPFPDSAGWHDFESDYFKISREANVVAELRDEFYRSLGLIFNFMDDQDYLQKANGVYRLFMEQIFRESGITPLNQLAIVEKSREQFGEITEILQSSGMNLFFFNRLMDHPLAFYSLLPSQKGDKYKEDAWVIKPSRGNNKNLFFFIRSDRFLYGKILYENLEELFSKLNKDYFVMGELRPFDFPAKNLNHPFFFCGAALIAEKGMLSHHIFRGNKNELFAVYGGPDEKTRPYTVVTGRYIHQDFIDLRYKKIWYLLLGAAFLMAFGFTSFFISQRIRAPLAQLAKGMDRIRRRNYSSKVLVSSADEFFALAEICNNLRSSLAEKERLTGFLAEGAVSSIADDDFCTSREEVSVLFCGILNGTDYDAMKNAERLEIFNSFLIIVQNQLFQNGGEVDKFTGNACLGFFRKEQIAGCSLQAAAAIRKALHDFNAELTVLNRKPLQVGIGVATGDVVLGYIGAEKRRDFTSIGNTVNMAARLETHAKNSDLPVTVFLDERTFLRNEEFTKAGIVASEQFNFRCYTGVFLKGKQGGQVIYELL